MRGLAIPRNRVAAEFLPKTATKEGLTVAGIAREDHRNPIVLSPVEAPKD
jgi:hypothetical protein